MTLIAETERLRLHEWTQERRVEFARVTNTPAVMRWLGGVSSPEMMTAALDRLQQYQQEFGFTFWAVERKEDDALLGFCGLKRANAPGAEHMHGQTEIGWRLREDAWGGGYAKEAAIASLDLAFGRFGAPHVIAPVAKGNLPSQGLMLRLGMRRWPEGDYVDRRFAEDDLPNPQLLFRIDRNEWQSSRATAPA